MERRKFNISAWAAVAVAIVLASTSAIQTFAVTKYKADTFERQAAEYRVELGIFQKQYFCDREKSMEELTIIKTSIARIEQKIDNYKGK
jgi:hypothetical protein